MTSRAEEIANPLGELSKLAYESGAVQMRERAAKFMEEYGCTACGHFEHDASPDLIRALPLHEEETKK